MNQISNALTQGFSYASILQYLLRHFPHAKKDIESALSKGFSPERIVEYLQGGRKAVNNPVTEHEKTRASDIEKKQSVKKELTKGALGIGATALGGYALSRALPKAAQVLTGELLPAEETPLQISGQSPQQIPYQPKQISGPEIPIEPISQQPPQAPIPQPVQTQTYTIAQQAPTLPIQQLPPLPKELQQHVSRIASIGNNPEQIEAYLKSFHPKEVKEYEKTAKAPIRTAIEEFVTANPSAQPKPPAVKPTKNQVAPQGAEQKRVSDNVEQSPEVSPFKDLIEEGKKKFDENYYPEKKNQEIKQPEIEKPKEAKKGSMVALPNGDIGEIKDIRQGIATVNAHGKEYRRKVEELIDSPIPEKDLSDLHDDLMKGIESKTGEEISRMVSFAGYDPNTNELAFVPHMGGMYVYDNISPEDAKELTNMLTQRKTSGENFIGAWKEGSKSPIGAAMSKLIQRLQKERGGKGSEYKGKYEKIYDALEPAKIASKEKHKEKQAEASRLKKEEKQKAKPPKPEKKTKKKKS